jgi:hypothetical protein
MRQDEGPGEKGQRKVQEDQRHVECWTMMGRPRLKLALVLMTIMGGLVVPSASSAFEAKPFGVTGFTMQTTGPTKEVPLGGSHFQFVNEPVAYTQAGGHPWALTTTVEFASEEFESQGFKTKVVVPTRDPKDVVVNLPAGLLGDPVAVPRCPLATVLGESKRCPPSTQVGVYRIRWFGGQEQLEPIVNVTPEAGQSAEFALENSIHIVPILTAHLVRTPQGYSFDVESHRIPNVEITRVETTFWGVPADPSHDAMRGLSCSAVGSERGKSLQCEPGSGGHASGQAPVPFLIWPTDCSQGAGSATVRADSWQEPGRVEENQRYTGYAEATATLPGVTGCGALSFNPTIGVEPDQLLADEPVGLGVNINVPQTESPQALATPHLRTAVVTLPEGMSVSPGVVDGIKACNAEGPEGINITGPESEEIAPSGELQLAPGHCPDASTVGTAEAITPLLPSPVKGHVYLARPGCGGPGQAACTEQDALDGNLYRLYLELGGTGVFGNAGIQIKVEGKTEANPATGQLTTVFAENPQAPFSELKVRLNAGPRAPIDNPATCGPAVTTSDFTPWSAPGITPEGLSVTGNADATPSSFFNVTGCAGTPSLTPGFQAGTVTPEAGAFSPFTLNFTRQDREQYLSGIQVHTPPGLLGMLSSVELCHEPRAAQGTCPTASKIGTTTVASGAGSHPFEISGNVYLTTGYKGAPFGLSIVTNAVAGPFNLGLVVVRSRIDVDPVTSQLTVTSDPLPQIIFGVPLRLQRVTVNIDRPGFMFNPTSCNAQQITAKVSGNQQAVANVSSPFAVGGCKSLDFKPQFTVTTSGKTSKQNGASLDAKVTYPPFISGSQANISYVKVELPKQLPSRLTTLQQACLAATFNANPANCPPGSIIGIVRTTTPVLPVELSGPVYFVSHGGESFPSLVAVLQGDGVRVDLTGTTFIDKHGITSSTFKSVPDVPVSTFELYLPEGPYSALAANTNLCSLTSTATVTRTITRRVHGRTIHQTVKAKVTKPASLLMPSEFVGQNGAVMKQTTKIAVTGCAKAATAQEARKAAAKRHQRGKR